MGRFGKIAALAPLLLGGCAAHGAEAVAPGAPLRSFHDGEWRGTGRLIAPGQADCGAGTITRSMRIQNGRAELDYDPAAGIRFSAEIIFGMAERARGPDPDAPNPTTLTMRSGTRIFRGEFRGDTFTGDYVDASCPRNWTMQRVTRPGD